MESVKSDDGLGFDKNSVSVFAMEDAEGVEEQKGFRKNSYESLN